MGKIRPGNDLVYSKDSTSRQFSVSLPTGVYEAQFVDPSGSIVWPTFVEEIWEDAPDCSMPGDVDITLSKPHIDCSELIRNGGQDETLTTSEPWVHNGPGVQVGNNEGLNNSDAIVTINRGSSSTGIGQSIDTRCVEMFSGNYVEFSAWIRLTNKDGTPATNINPDVSWWYRQSPQYKELP